MDYAWDMRVITHEIIDECTHVHKGLGLLHGIHCMNFIYAIRIQREINPRLDVVDPLPIG